ncbi:MAG: alpha-rhamnosidase [Clostridia bacterium]|nr:alpha-rhamnosidase [Clostridia bacterium]
MNHKSYWIWHYGDYEIFHTMNLHLRREEQGRHIPPFWKISTPYASVKFHKRIDCGAGYLICYINGSGYVAVDNVHYCEKTRIELAPGAHTVEIHVSNHGGLPAAFVESDVCPSDESWTCNHFAGEFLPVGCNEHFCRREQNPEIFPFAYKNVLPITKEKVNGGILFDFGTELFGYLNLNGADEKNEIDVFYGESREEALDTEYSYITDQVFGKSKYRLRQRAFRYVYMKGLSENATVSADYEYIPLEPRGSFACNNELFNKIISVASYTFHLNCREAFLDGIKRDRWVWAGDAYQSARINRYLFADKEIEQRTLIGLIGKEPIEQHINTILDYSLLWIIALYEHYMTYGDKAFLNRIYPMAKRLLEFCETRLNSDGFLEGRPGDWTFIDWSKFDKCGALCAEQMLLIKVYSVMAAISEELQTGERDEMAEKSETLKSRVNEYYWNEDAGAFIDSYQSGKNHVTRHANIFAVMYGIASEEQAQRILKNVLKNDQVTKIKTPYFEGYELDALAKLGEFGTVEEVLTSYYGGMINLGAQTLWEEYHPEMSGIQHYAMYGGKYEKSLCHAWGAGPIYLFGRYYLGVRATSAGYETFTVEPRLGGLEEICGTVPTGEGAVTVKLNKETLSVVATKAGGTLLWKGNRYRLKPDEPVVIDY